MSDQEDDVVELDAEEIEEPEDDSDEEFEDEEEIESDSNPFGGESMKLDQNTLLVLLGLAGIGYYLYSQSQTKKAQALMDAATAQPVPSMNTLYPDMSIV